MIDSKLAQVIAHQEGFYVHSSLPQRQNNPGDLRHAPGESHPEGSPNSVGSFSDPATGWAMLERQLNLDAERGNTIEQLVETYAPPNENNTQGYLNFVCTNVPCNPNDLVSDVLKIPGD